MLKSICNVWLAVPLAGTMAMLLAGCGSSLSPEAQAKRMAGACQTRYCSCQQEELGILTKTLKVPVEWRLNGDAYCPEGYQLKFDGPPTSSLRPS
ncbi:MAG: hypothetical protein RIB84_28405 [Sneathiellaceae bacterium]